MRLTRLAVITVALGVGAATTTLGLPTGSADPGSAAYVSVDGTSTSCTADAPCGSISAALSVATSGSTIVLEPGSYPAQKLGWHPKVAGFASPVTIEPDQAGSVTLAGLNIDVSNLDLEGLDIVDGGVRFGANDITVDGFDVNGEELDGGPSGGQGAGIAVSGTSSNIIVAHSTIEGMVDRDGIDVGDGTDAESDLSFTDNRIIAAVEGPLHHHTDCFQLFGGQTDVTLTGNLFGGCTVSELMLQAATAPIDNVLVADNDLIACTTPGANSCDYFTIYVDPLHGNPITNLRFSNNTITGSLSLAADPASFTGNILTGNFGGDVCGGAWENDNLIGVAPATKACPVGIVGHHDTMGLPTFVDPADWNYALAPGSLTPAPPAVALPPTTKTSKPVAPRVLHGRLSSHSVHKGSVLTVIVGTGGHPLAHVTVSAAHRVLTTNRFGRARFRIRHVRFGVHVVRLAKAHFRSATLRFTVGRR